MVHSPATAHPPKNARSDPVCGMSVSADAEFRTEHTGREYLFCSRDCRDRFQADPERYLPETPAGRAESGDEGHRHPHDPALAGDPSGRPEEDTPLPCPDGSCATGASLYTCPMHPEVRQGNPGPAPNAACPWSRLHRPLR